MTGGTTGREIGMGIKGRIMMETVGAVKNLIRIINQVPKKMMVGAILAEGVIGDHHLILQIVMLKKTVQEEDSEGEAAEEVGKEHQKGFRSIQF